MKSQISKQILCLFLILWVSLSASAQQSLWVGQSYRMDVSSAVMGLTANVKWSTSGGYLSMSGSGFYRDIKVTQYFSGTATVTCEWDYKLYSGGNYTHMRRQVTISCRDNQVSISPQVLNLKVGESSHVSYRHAYSNQYTSAANAYFQSTNPYVCTVDESGNVTAVGEGFAYINVYSKISSGAPYCQVTVTKPVIPATAITFDLSKIEINRGSSRSLTAKLTPSDATSELTWSTSDRNIVTVTNEGVITGVAPGMAEVTVKTDNGYSATVQVEVKKTRLTLSVNPDPGRYETGTIIKLSASDPEARIYYTTDGTTPSADSRLYNSPLTLSDKLHLKAIALHNQYLDSYILTADYSIPTVKVINNHPLTDYSLTPAYQMPEIAFTEAIQPGPKFDKIEVKLNNQPIAFEKQIKKNVLSIIPKTDVSGATLHVIVPEDAVTVWNQLDGGNSVTEQQWNFATINPVNVKEISPYYYLFSNGDACVWDPDGDSLKVVFDNVRHLVDSNYYITQDNYLMGFGPNFADYEEDKDLHILGDGTTQYAEKPVIIGYDVIKAVTKATRIFMQKDGTVWTWGSNRNGLIGNNQEGENKYQLKPFEVLHHITDFVSCPFHMLAITEYGWLYGWGYNLPLGETKITYRPTLLATGGVVEVAGGTNHSIWLDKQGNVYTVGLYDFGQTVPGAGSKVILSPKKITTNGAHVYATSVGSYVLEKDGSFYLFGEVDDIAQVIKVTDNVKNAQVAGSSLAMLKQDSTLWMIGFGSGGFYGTDRDTAVTATIPQLIAEKVLAYWLTENRLFVKRSDGWIWTIGGEITELTKLFPDNRLELKEVSLPEKMEMRMESEGYAQISMNPRMASYDEIQWSSSNPDVATVDEFGIIRSHSEGETDIQALVGANGNEFTATCKLTISGANTSNEEITVNPTDVVTIYDMKGTHQFTGNYRDWVPRQKGVYLICLPDRTVTCVR